MKNEPKKLTESVNLPPTFTGLMHWMLAVIQTEEPGSKSHATAVEWFHNCAKLADTADTLLQKIKNSD